MNYELPKDIDSYAFNKYVNIYFKVGQTYLRNSPKSNCDSFYDEILLNTPLRLLSRNKKFQTKSTIHFLWTDLVLKYLDLYIFASRNDGLHGVNP